MNRPVGHGRKLYLDGVLREFHSLRRVREQPEEERGWALKQISRHATRQERNVDVAPRQRVQQRPNPRHKVFSRGKCTIDADI